MIKFFRKIRQHLLTENKFTKYLIYAMGEIVLVVIGILIALQINNWKQNREDRNNETKYLKAMVIELERTMTINKKVIQKRNIRKLSGLNLAKEYCENKIQIADTLSFLNNVSYGAVNSGELSIGTKDVYNELLNTGNFRLLKSDTIKKAIVNYYNSLDAFNKRIIFYASNFTSYLNSLRPFYTENPDSISNYDQVEMLDAFKSDEFRRLVDLEIAYSYKVNDYVNKLESMSKKLIAIIEKKIGTKIKV